MGPRPAYVESAVRFSSSAYAGSIVRQRAERRAQHARYARLAEQFMSTTPVQMSRAVFMVSTRGARWHTQRHKAAIDISMDRDGPIDCAVE